MYTIYLRAFDRINVWIRLSTSYCQHDKITWSAWPFNIKCQHVNKARVQLFEKAQATQNQATTTPPTRPDRTTAVTAAAQGRPPQDVIGLPNVSTRCIFQQTPKIIQGAPKRQIVRTIQTPYIWGYATRNSLQWRTTNCFEICLA